MADRPLYLLDVNLLIALFDPSHVDHDLAHEWFAAQGHRGWATCPITETGVLRVLCNPGYPNAQDSPRVVVASLRTFIANHRKTHVFWPDDVSILDPELFDASVIQGHKQLTDIYLLGLCQRRQGTLATLDKRITARAIVNGTPSLLEILS